MAIDWGIERIDRLALGTPIAYEGGMITPSWRVYSHGRLIATIANMTRSDLRLFFPNAIINVTDHTVIELSWGPI